MRVRIKTAAGLVLYDVTIPHLALMDAYIGRDVPALGRPGELLTLEAVFESGHFMSEPYRVPFPACPSCGRER